MLGDNKAKVLDGLRSRLCAGQSSSFTANWGKPFLYGAGFVQDEREKHKPLTQSWKNTTV